MPERHTVCDTNADKLDDLTMFTTTVKTSRKASSGRPPAADTTAAGVADKIVDLINYQLGEQDKTTRQEVEDVFSLNSLDGVSLNKLDNILREEQKAFPLTTGRGPDDMWLQGLRYEWTKSMEEFHTREEEEVSNPLSMRCAKTATVWTLSLVFHLDTLAHMGGGFPELERLHATVAPILEHLEVDVDMRILPVNEPKVESADLCCVVNSRLETRSEYRRPSAHTVEYALNHLGAPIDLVSADKIRVEFVIQDAVNCASPWGSAPLLHVGSNFRVGPEAVVTEFKSTGSGTVKQTSCSYTSDYCFVYNRKDPTLEMPSKLNEVADSLCGLATEVGRVFHQKNPIRFLPRKLILSLALCHPKIRIRLAVCTYVICYLPTTSFNRRYNQKSHHIDNGHFLVVGRGLKIDIDRYKISRKLSLVSREPCRVCSRICDHGGHPAHTHGRVPDFSGGRSVESVLPEYQHGQSIGKDIITPTCESTTMVHHFFCEGVVPCYIDSVFKGNDRMPVLDRVKSSLVVYGKALDTGATENSYLRQDVGKKTRLRTFIYNQRRHCGSADNAVITQNTYYDLMEQKCDLDAARRHLIASRVLCDNGVDANNVDRMDRWRPLILKTIETHRAARLFADQLTHLCKDKIKEELTSSPNIDKARALCKRFARVCHTYNQIRQNAFRGTAFRDAEGRGEGDVQSENVTTLPSETRKFADIASSRTVPWNPFWDQITKTLTTLADRRQATMLVMSNRAIAVASRMVIRGARCIVSSNRQEGESGKVKLHQFLMAADGMVVAPTTIAALSHFSVCRDGVSATTAPNDDLPETKLKTAIPLPEHRLSTHRPAFPETNSPTAVIVPRPYVIPQLRQGGQGRAYHRLPSGRWRQPQKTNDSFKGYGARSIMDRC